MTRYSVVLIGLGRIGWRGFLGAPHMETHYQAISAHPRLALLAGCDVDPKTRMDFTARTGIACYEAITQLPHADIAVIAVPASLHASIGCAMGKLDHVKAALIEKPLAPTLKECRALVKTFSSKPLLVGHQRRYEERHASVRDFIASEHLGKLLAATCEFAIGPTGRFLENGCHAIDTLRFLAPEVPRRITPGEGFRCAVACERGLVEIESRTSLTPGYLTNMYDDLIECLETGRIPTCSGEDGLIAVRESLEAEELWNARSEAATGRVTFQGDRSAKPWSATLSGITECPTPGSSTPPRPHSTRP